jgi:hypothetical protein
MTTTVSETATERRRRDLSVKKGPVGGLKTNSEHDHQAGTTLLFCFPCFTFVYGCWTAIRTFL